MRARTKILVVDDSPDFQMLVRAFLSEGPHVVLSAGDTLQATGTALREKPSVILVDIGLPGGDGWTLIDRLKANTFTSRTPVIVVTGQNTKGLEERAKTKGAADFLQKPIDKHRLLTTLDRLLNPPLPLTAPAAQTGTRSEPPFPPLRATLADHSQKY